MRRNPHMQIRGVSAVVANFHKKNAAIQRGARTITVLSSRNWLRLARQVVPYDTGRMSRSLTASLSPSRLTYTGHYDEAVFAREGQPFYPLFVELGTRLMPARPTLRWAYNIENPIYRAEISALLKRETRR